MFSGFGFIRSAYCKLSKNFRIFNVTDIVKQYDYTISATYDNGADPAARMSLFVCTDLS